MGRRPKQPISTRLRNSVLKRDNYTCRYCGSKEGPFHIDHVYPESKGGATSLDNLVTACRSCNEHKSYLVGIWPKPIGYFDDKEYAKKREIDQEKTIGELSETISARKRRSPSPWVFFILILSQSVQIFGLGITSIGGSNELLVVGLIMAFSVFAYLLGWKLKG